MVSEEKYLTADEVSARYGQSVTPATLANWRFKKTGPVFVKIGGRVLYPLTDLLKWEATQRREPVER